MAVESALKNTEEVILSSVQVRGGEVVYLDLDDGDVLDASDDYDKKSLVDSETKVEGIKVGENTEWLLRKEPHHIPIISPPKAIIREEKLVIEEVSEEILVVDSALTDKAHEVEHKFVDNRGEVENYIPRTNVPQPVISVNEGDELCPETDEQSNTSQLQTQQTQQQQAS